MRTSLYKNITIRLVGYSYYIILRFRLLSQQPTSQKTFTESQLLQTVRIFVAV